MKLNNLINVGMGQLYVSSSEDVYFETLVGSCIALFLYDKTKNLAGIAHVMLPTNPDGKKTIDPMNAGKYADEALESLIARLISRGGKLENIIAKLIGGANMFSHESGKSYIGIGEKNIKIIKLLLHEKKIPIISEDLGGQHGRKILFEVKTGKVICKKQKEEIVL